jgi:hypothetical protein
MPVEAHMMLGTAAWLEGNSLTLIGAGWTVRPPDPFPMAVAVVLYFPRDQQGVHTTRLELLYASGEPVLFDTPDGPQPLVYDNELDITGLDDPNLTTPLDSGFVVNLPPHPLPRGREYVWRLSVDGGRKHWTVPFRTTPPAPARGTQG